jgi:hypothetical protein
MRKDRSWVLADSDELARRRDENRPRGRIRLLLAAGVKGGIVAPLLACNPKGGYDPTETLTSDPPTTGTDTDGTTTTTATTVSSTADTTSGTTGTTEQETTVTVTGTTSSETTGTGAGTGTGTDTDTESGGSGTDTESDETTGSDGAAVPSPSAASRTEKNGGSSKAQISEPRKQMRTRSARPGDEPKPR